MGKTIVNIDEFFTTTNENTGVWHEPVIDGVGCGFELLLTGANTDENVIASDQYSKDLKELEKVKDLKKKSEQRKRLDAARMAGFVHGIRGKDGNELRLNGKPLEYSDDFIKELMYESFPLQEDTFKFCFKTSNFMQRKKNN